MPNQYVNSLTRFQLPLFGVNISVRKSNGLSPKPGTDPGGVGIFPCRIAANEGKGSWDGAVKRVPTLASQQNGTDSISRAQCHGPSLLWVLTFTPRVFLWFLRFYSPPQKKKNIPNSNCNSTWIARGPGRKPTMWLPF